MGIFMNKNYEYLSDEHAKYIRNIVKEVKKKDENYKIFGAKTHQYQLNETVSLEWVRAFEKKYHIELPEEYVFFITKVGNGGAGPYYGVEPLKDTEQSAKFYKHLSKESIYNDNYLQFYKECVAFFDNEEPDDEKGYDELDKKYDEFCDKINYGTLGITNQGCTFDTLLVVNGSRKGEIVYVDWNLELDYPPKLIHMTFLEWYQGYFEEILAGYDVYGYGYHMLGDEKELIEKYACADLHTKNKIISSFFKFPTIEQETIKFISNFDGISDIARLKLLLEFDEEQGLQIFDNFFESGGEKIKVAINACMKIRDKDQYYDKMLRLIYGGYGNFDDNFIQTALIFIQGTNKLSAADLFEFVKNKENSEEIRHTAMYVIGGAKDKDKFIDTFIDILNHIDSEMILLETLVALNNVESEKIAQTYKTLIPKYENSDNFLIVKNMKYYIKEFEQI